MTITRTYAHDIDINDVPEITVDGTRYLPLMGNRVDPDLAARRRAARAAGLVNWSDVCCTPGYTVVYRPADCASIKAMGTLWGVAR